MSTDRPNASELATAVREFLEAEILPVLTDHRLRFRTLVAMNALSIVEREAPGQRRRTGPRHGGSARATSALAISTSCARRSRHGSQSPARATWIGTRERAPAALLAAGSI